MARGTRRHPHKQHHRKHHRKRHRKHHQVQPPPPGPTPTPTPSPTPPPGPPPEADPFEPGSYDATPVPTLRERHMLSRMGCGWSGAAYADLLAAGDELTWFEQQLDPESVPESELAAPLADWFPRLQDAPAQKMANFRNDVYGLWDYGEDLGNLAMLRRIFSRRSVLENMVEFWSNHLHVPCRTTPEFVQRVPYDAMIRSHALGRFDDLLVAASLHPAMLLYLDNWKSVRNAPNENQGREVLELHTVGRESYTEPMVKDSARLLSGWTVRTSDWTAYYDPTKHTTGAVDLLGFADPNTTNDPGLAERYLRFLAHHPSTAHQVASKLAVRFVSDTPSSALVDSLAQTYLDSGTDIKATLRALVSSDEFWASVDQKVRTPLDDTVATCRVLGVTVLAPAQADSFANRVMGIANSVAVYSWSRPDGPPDSAGSWATTTRILNSLRMHWGMAGGSYPRNQVQYRTPLQHLPTPYPERGLPFRLVVDHLSRTLLGRVSTSRLLQSACIGCDIEPDEVISPGHALIGWKFPRLLAVLLDSPAHLTR